jgi:hypothetical protein
MSRANKGKPGLFDIFNTSFAPQGSTPTEQGMQQFAISSLLGAQGQQQKSQDRTLRNRLTEAQIGATKAQTVQRLSSGGVDPLTPSSEGTISNSITDGLNNAISSDIGLSVDLEGTSGKEIELKVGDKKEKKTPGQHALDTVMSDPYRYLDGVLNDIDSRNLRDTDKKNQTDMIIRKHFGTIPQQDIDAYLQMRKDGVTLDDVKAEISNVTDEIIDNFSATRKLRDKENPKGFDTNKKQLKSLLGNERASDIVKLNLIKDMNAKGKELSPRNLLGLKEDIMSASNDELDDNEKNFLNEILSSIQPEFDRAGQIREDKINKTFQIEESVLNDMFSKLLNRSVSSEYQKLYEGMLTKFEGIKDKQEFINKIQELSNSDDIRRDARIFIRR